MADDAPVPISTSVPETVTIDTGADAKTLGDLNKEFADFWSEQDSGAPDTTAPAAPDTGAGQETKETKVEPPPKPKPEPPKEKAPSRRLKLTNNSVTTRSIRWRCPPGRGSRRRCRLTSSSSRTFGRQTGHGSNRSSSRTLSSRPSCSRLKPTLSPRNRKQTMRTPPPCGGSLSSSATRSSCSAIKRQSRNGSRLSFRRP